MVQRFGEADSQNGLATRELAIDLEPQAPFLVSHCREPGEQLGGESAQRAHAAQHDSFATSFVNACAASLIPSESVKYGWKVAVRSSIVSPNLIASAGSVIISPASAARMCAPMIFWVAPSATSLTNPRVSRAASARGTCSDRKSTRLNSSHGSNSYAVF